jgi:DNA-binding LacI/PurR family transcriptional regulator
MVGIGSFKSRALDSVVVDLRKGIHEAVRHLLARKPKRIAMLTSPDHTSRDDAVIDAYCDALDEAGLPMEFLYADEPTRESGARAVAQFLPTRGTPDAMIAYNDVLCVGALAALREAGISVPGQTAIIGCGGIDELRFHQPAISTIEHPIEEICRIGWTFLMNRLAEPERQPQHTVLQAKLVVRESSALN